MSHGLKRMLKVAFLELTVAVVAVLPLANMAYANTGVGYFRGQAINSSLLSDVLTGRPNAVPSWAYTGASQAAIKANFISWLDGLVTQNSTATTQNTIGGAFIVNTMLSSASHTLNVSSSMWNDVVNRINNPNVSISTETQDPNNYCLPGSCPISFYYSPQADDFFTSYTGAASGLMVVFKDSSGRVLYVIEVTCANPVGGLPGLPAAQPPIGVYDALDCTYAQGWAFDWDNSSASIRVDVQVDGVTQIWQTTDQYRPDVNAAYGISGNHGFKDDISRWVSDGGSHTVQPYAIGIDAAGNYDGYTIPLGVKTVSGCTPPTAYTLTPTATVSSALALPGQTVGLTYNVQNVQTTGVQSNLTYWGLREVTIPATTATPAQFGSYIDNSLGCPTFVGYGGGITCREISDSTTAGNPIAWQFPGSPGGTTTTMTTAMLSSPTAANTAMFNNISVPVGTTPGTRICRVLSVNPRDQGSLLAGETYHNRDSAVSCVMVASSPYVAVVGGDAWAGGSTISPYNGTGTFRGVGMPGFGSFGEYGILATGSVNFFGSAGALGAPSSATGNVSGPLTFANTPSLGSFSSWHQITDLSSQYASAVNTPGVLNASNQIVASGVYKAAADITLNSATLPLGVHSVIYAPSNTVTIAGNIIYNSSGATKFVQVPSLVIVAKKIQINGVVQRVDGSLYALSSFVSCTEGPVSPGASAAITTTGACRNTLTLNGSLSVAQQAVGSTVFNRSFGGQATGQPAEMLTMRPEVFITTYEVNSQPSSAILRTVQETELPARY